MKTATMTEKDRKALIDIRHLMDVAEARTASHIAEHFKGQALYVSKWHFESAIEDLATRLGYSSVSRFRIHRLVQLGKLLREYRGEGCGHSIKLA